MSLRRSLSANLSAVAAVALLAPISLASAQTADRVARNPAELDIQIPSMRKMEDKAGKPVLRIVPGNEALLSLNIVYSDPETTRIFNPATNSYDKVKLRTYNGKLVAPTIRVRPGDTVRATLTNSLPTETCGGGDLNTPHCFNDTNLHAHGLWVSPAGNSDNVLLRLRPTKTFQYEYNIPADHPAGLYWYHPHVHGSTALQVAGGMGGALIVEGRRPPTLDAPGDIDTILRDRAGRAFQERVVLLQQIQYACRDAQGQIKKRTDASGKVVAWVCDPGDVGTIEGYDQFGPTTWQDSNRYTTVNGEVQPHFLGARTGQIERWRVVHAGVRDTVNLAIIKAKAGAQPIAPGMGPAQQLWMQENCADPAAAKSVANDPALTQWEFASDGQTHSRFIGRKTSVLQPAYRSDFLVMFNEPGLYCVVDRGANPGSTANNQEKTDRLLGFVDATGKAVKGDDQAIIQKELIAAAAALPAEVREDVRWDLADGLRIPRFAPHKPVADREIKGQQSMVFSIGDKQTGKVQFMVDGKPFNPNDPARTVILGTAEEWTLTAANDFKNPGTAAISHPFHIHINPFEIVRILDTQGRDVTDPAIPRETRLAWEGNDPQYLDLKGTWRDTVFVKQDYKVIMRTRYERYIGDYVLHCHILDHEDQGMMQMVRIILDESNGTTTASAASGHSH